MSTFLFPHGLGDLVQAVPHLAAIASGLRTKVSVGVLARLRAAVDLLQAQPFVGRVFGIPDPWNDYAPANTWEGYRMGLAALRDCWPHGRLIETPRPSDPLDPLWCKSYRIAHELGIPWNPTGYRWPDSPPMHPEIVLGSHRPMAVLHGTSGNAIKDLPKALLHSVADTTMGTPCFGVPIPSRDTYGDLRPLPWHAALLRKAAVMVGVDSGPAHLSSVLGVRTVWIFTETPVQQALPFWLPNVRAIVAGHRAQELLDSWRAWRRANQNLVPVSCEDPKTL